MNKFIPNFKDLKSVFINNNLQLAAPIFVLVLLAMLILPLPALALDIFFTFNIVLSLIIVLVATSVKRPLDFSVFPTIILTATLLRLGLNIASTRVVLLNGQNGPSSAGHVIESFGNVVVGGNFVVGLVVFIILMIINFVVITKGAERISEVSARFTLDALPGKQMAIDADLNAGLINQKQAQNRRKEVATESDFYGAMDGASKFVRGDAVASMLILVINLIGGVAIGSIMHDLSLGESFKLYALLTIGDGLVAQIPALLLSFASAIIVTRINDSNEIQNQIFQQMLANPTVLYSTAAVMLILGLIPGMPYLPFLTFSAVLVFAGWRMTKNPIKEAEENIEDLKDFAEELTEELSYQNLPVTEKLSIKLGYRLVNLLEPSQGEPLIKRLKGIRQTLSENLGFILPFISARDDLTLEPEEYKILLNDSIIASAKIYPNKLMALKGSLIKENLEGIKDFDPAYNVPVIWIENNNKAHALGLGFQVVDNVSVIATHLSKIIRDNCEELISFEDVHFLNERLTQLSPKLAENLEKSCSLNQQLNIFKYLLKENVSLKNIVQIATTLIEAINHTQDPILLAAEIRCSLKRQIFQQIVGNNKNKQNEISVFTLNNSLEQLLLTAFYNSRQNKNPIDNFPLEPQLLNQLQNHLKTARDLMQQNNNPPVLLVNPQLRPLLAKLSKSFAKGLNILSFNEIPEDKDLNILGNLG